MYDYHMHSEFSFDSSAPLRAQLAAAQSAGLREICLTEHVDFDGSGAPPADIAARNAALCALLPEFPALTVRMGAEVSIGDAAAAANAKAHLAGCHLDFIIGSVHMVDGVDTYYPEYHRGKTLEQSYRKYLAYIAEHLATNDYFSVMGHYDFVAKYAPYPDRTLRYAVCPEEFDSIFRQLVSRGKGMEINTSAWQDGPCWGLDVLTRYRELGGEFVTVGSDAHKPERVGRRIGEALDLARAAGIPYTATFENLRPVLHRL